MKSSLNSFVNSVNVHVHFTGTIISLIEHFVLPETPMKPNKRFPELQNMPIKDVN